jgi:predicted peptidase
LSCESIVKLNRRDKNAVAQLQNGDLIEEKSLENLSDDRFGANVNGNIVVNTDQRQ